MKSSVSDPLRIAQVSPPGAPGVIGLTLCPGKKDRARGWDRDLDIEAIRDCGAMVVVSLIEDSEFEFLEVTGLSTAIERHGMRWVVSQIYNRSVCRDP